MNQHTIRLSKNWTFTNYNDINIGIGLVWNNHKLAFMINILFWSITYYKNRKLNRKIIEAKINSPFGVTINNKYNETSYITLESDNINLQSTVYWRNPILTDKLELVRIHNELYDGNYYIELIKTYEFKVAKKDEIWIFPPSTKVLGYIYGEKFVITSKKN